MSDQDKPKPESSGSGSFPGYRIEAKVEHFVRHRPVVIKDKYDGDIILDEVWRGVSTFKAPSGMGVPREDNESMFFVHGYESAMALAWTLVATNPHSSILVRLVPYKIHYTHETWRDGEPEVIGNGGWLTKELKNLGEKLEEREKKAEADG